MVYEVRTTRVGNRNGIEIRLTRLNAPQRKQHARKNSQVVFTLVVFSGDDDEIENDNDVDDGRCMRDSGFISMHFRCSTTATALLSGFYG